MREIIQGVKNAVPYWHRDADDAARIAADAVAKICQQRPDSNLTKLCFWDKSNNRIILHGLVFNEFY